MAWFRRLAEFAQRTLIDLVLVGVGLIATFLSVQYTYGWHVWSGDELVEGAGFSIMIVLFSIIMFEFAVEASNKKSKWAIPMFLAWLLTAVYSMQATMAGQYIRIQQKALERFETTKEMDTAGPQLEVARRSLENLRAEILPYEDRQKELMKVLSSITTVEQRYEWKKTIASTEAELTTVNAKLDEYRKRIQTAEEEERKLVLLVTEDELRGSAGDVYAFYSQVLGIEDVEKVEFWMTVYRSVALDTVNVLCFMLVIVRRRKRELGSGDDRSGKGDGVPAGPESRRDEYGESSDVVEDGGGPALACERKEVESRKTDLEVLAEDTYSPGRRNGTFTSWERARKLGCDKAEYERIVRAAFRRGVLVRRHGVMYRNGYYGKEDFIREVLTEGW